MNLEEELVLHPKGTCYYKSGIPYLLYTKDNWADIKKFCAPFAVEKTEKGASDGRALVDLPTGNESFTYGIILVKLGTKRILFFHQSEFGELFKI
ncbi:hypothetical protein [Enterococcus sp. DIV0187]|uniref:hypothetical protein n=1 Tax=Enterococcus sp. DIV0187 TaxID=2774644 RepID=UPI003F22800E